MRKIIRDRLVLEGFGCKRNLDCVQSIYDFLVLLSQEANMRILVPPSIVRVPVEHAAAQIETTYDWGVSGTVIWLESGASVHTWPEAEFVALDVFSCKTFDHRRVEDVFAKTFDPDRVERMESLRIGGTDV